MSCTELVADIQMRIDGTTAPDLTEQAFQLMNASAC